MHNLSRLGAVLGSRVNVIELEGRRMSVKSALLASTLYLDAVGDPTGCLCICSHVFI
jgi:hypothetical protein